MSTLEAAAPSSHEVFHPNFTQSWYPMTPQPEPLPSASPDLGLEEVGPEALVSDAELILERLERLEQKLSTLSEDVRRLQPTEAPAIRVPSPPQPQPEEPVMTYVPPLAEPEPPIQMPSSSARGWLWWEIVRDGMRTLWMLIDSRYRMAWSTRFVVIALFIAIFTSHWFNPLGYLLPEVLERMLDKVVVLILGFLLYKVLGRELVRYHEYMARWPGGK